MPFIPPTTSLAGGGRRVHMSVMDRLWLGGTTVIAVGPVEVPDREDVVRALREVAAGGTAARVGLQFDTDGRNWRFDASGLDQWCSDSVQQTAAVGPEDLETLMTSIGRSATVERPLRITLAGSFVVLALRHALGDARFATSLLHVLLDFPRSGELPEWVHEPVDRHPLRSAMVQTFGRTPQTLRELVSQLRRPAVDEPTTDRATASDVAEPSQAFRSEPVVVSAPGTAQARKDMTRWGRANHKGASQSAIVLAVVAQALGEAGIACEPTVHMVFDARKFLPAGRATHGNFVIGLNLPVNPTDVAAVTTLTAAAAASARPLAAMAAGCAKELLARRGAAPASVPRVPQASLALSFIPKSRVIDGLPWAVGNPEERIYACRVDPAGPTAITIVPVVVGKTMGVTASFHASVFDPDVVRAALHRAATAPVELLEQIGAA